MPLPSDEKGRGIFKDYYQGLIGGKLVRWLDFQKVRIINRSVSNQKSGSVIVDLGCGAAAITRRVADANPDARVIGADLDPEILEIAAARGIETRLADFDAALPFDDDSVDVVLMIDTIEHVERRQETLDAVTRILTPEGQLIVFTPPYDSAIWNVAEMFHTLLTRRTTYDHISPFTRESLSWHLREKFENWKVGRTNFGLTMWAIASNKRQAPSEK